MKTANRMSTLVLLAVAFGFGVSVGKSTPGAAQTKNRVFELRIATVADKEKLNVLMDRSEERCAPARGSAAVSLSTQ